MPPLGEEGWVEDNSILKNSELHNSNIQFFAADPLPCPLIATLRL